MTGLDASFAYCRRVARRRARNFYYSFLLLPRERKDAMCAIYAFMRYADDLSDDGDPSAAERRRALDAWRRALADALEGRPGGDPLWPAFRATVERYSIPRGYFFELIDGVESDLEPRRFTTFDELYRYCYRVASVVGLTVTHIFGFDDPRALELAEKCGVGFQLTNILRDIPEDAGMGRVYLPDEDLARFGVAREEILAAGGGRGPASPAFARLMDFEWRRADSYYAEAAPLLELVGASSQPALWAMIAIYRGILARIRALDYDVYRERPRLTTLEKYRIVARAARKRWLGGALPFPA